MQIAHVLTISSVPMVHRTIQIVTIILDTVEMEHVTMEKTRCHVHLIVVLAIHVPMVPQIIQHVHLLAVPMVHRTIQIVITFRNV